MLLGHVLQVNRAWLYAHADARLNAVQRDRFDALLQGRKSGVPIAYLLGHREFYGRDFTVTPAVLIPRPETELVVETALEKLDDPGACVVDVGTGSGCIALTLAAERPDWQVSAVDISDDALAVCRANADRLALKRVEILQGDLLAPVADRRFDAVVSNPPYVAAKDPHLTRGDLRFEPGLALSADRQGLEVIERLLDQAVTCLHPGGWLIIEHGHQQAATVRQLFSQAGLTQISTRRDLADIERVTLGTLP